jgi:endonuclease/exonuclease/phosphatase family metal-dependent hydrolase
MKRLSPVLIFMIGRRSAEGLLLFREHLRKRLAIPSSFLILVTCLLSCGTVQVYEEADRPVFHSGENALQTTEQADSLSVVTFNIRKAVKTQLAASELQQFQKTRNADVYLLQEMDEKGVKEIAKSLSLNYLYIPIVHNISSKKDVGNAILTKGAITCPEKLLLPHAKPLSKSRRVVTIAEVTVHQEKVLVYSVQTETVVMSRKKRMDQVDAIIEHARRQLPAYKYVLIGGDFNTLFTKSSELAVEKFRSNGFDWSTATVGTTASAFFGLLKPKHDYIFSKGLKLVDASKMEASRSSDHYPVLATFSMKP